MDEQWIGLPIPGYREATHRFSTYECWPLRNQPQMETIFNKKLCGTLEFMQNSADPVFLSTEEMILCFASYFETSPTSCCIDTTYPLLLSRYQPFYLDSRYTWSYDTLDDNNSVYIVNETLNTLIRVSASLEEFILRVIIENSIWRKVVLKTGRLSAFELRYCVLLSSHSK